MSVEGGSSFGRAVEWHDTEPSRGGVPPLSPEQKTYPPQQVIRIRPGEDFSVDFNLDPERVKALGLHSTGSEEEEVHDVVLLEVEGTPPVKGEIRVVKAYSGLFETEYPAVLLGKDGGLVSSYLLDVYFDRLPEKITREIGFSISSPAAEILSAKMLIIPDSEEGITEARLDYWRVPDKDSPLTPIFSQHDLSGIRYRLELPQEAATTP